MVKKKIGLMGGTFDPIHVAHVQIASAAKKEFALDEVWFLPTGESYHKHPQDSSTADRAGMVQAAISDIPYFSLCDIDMRRSGATYTADTLRELQNLYPDVRFYYLVGADSLDYMDRWVRPEEIFSRAVILAASRSTQTDEQVKEKMEQLKERFQAEIHLIQEPAADISSTRIKEKIRNGEDVSEFLPEKTLEYIAVHNLYRT